MKKISIFLMMLCFAVFGVANAQTLTVADGTATNQYIPVYAYSGDTDGTTSEFIIPANELSVMSGKDITSMTFYLAQTASKTWTAVYKVYMKEVDYTTLDATVGPNASSVVYTGTLDGSNDEMIITFDEAYTYGGSNLLIGTYVETSGAWDSNGQYYGIEAEGTAYLSGSWGGYDDGGFDFIPKTTFAYETPASCPKPTALAVTTDGATATATWVGNANNYNIDINGAVIENVTSPYTFDVELSTTYNVMVQANCGGGDLSSWTNAYSFTTPDCLLSESTVINYTLTDSYGDGWNGNYILVVEGCLDDGVIVAQLTINNGTTLSGTLNLCGDSYLFVWYKGSYPTETSWEFTDASGNTLFSGAGNNNMATGDVLYTIGTPIPTDLTAGTPETTSVELSWTENGTARAWQICVNDDVNNLIDVNRNPYTLQGLTPDTDYTVKVRAVDGSTSCWSDEVTFTTEAACDRPTGLTEANITTETANLSWSGSHESYTVQLMPWLPASDDVIPTATMTRYTFPLTGTGTGSVTIRHYDVTNMFRLIVDDIIVKNAAGEVIYTQNFETSGGNMPSEFTTMDVDGDGYGWEVVDNTASYVNGNYGLSSASWTSTTGALFPDNWIILNGIELGGEISFAARGQDPSFAAEKFCVYVCADANMVEDHTTNTTYGATGLTPNTPYTWQVSGLCSNGYESQTAASLFKTLDDVMVFTTTGAWDEASNWDLGRVPTGDDKVRLDANATINSGVVGYAKKIVNTSTGTITIKDGGQLKQTETAVVTIEKEIEAVGENNWNADNNDGYYFIASPLTTTLFSQQTDWASVDITSSGTYDLYSFDPTQELEWVNFNNSDNTGDDFNRLFNGQGYLYANKDGYTLTFEGSTAVASLNNTVTQDFTFDETSTDNFNGWALVGNPFTCNAYLSYVDANGDALEANFYTLNNSNTYSLVSSSNPLTPCSGALINYSATGSIQFASEAPAKRTGFLNMNVSRGNKTVDQARVRFGQGHNLQHMSFRNGSRLYMNVDGNDYAVVYTENQGEMPVSFNAAENGTYTISFNTEDVELGYLHLIDNMTGNDVNLLATPSYSFEAKTTDYASRFRLVFATGNADDEFAFFSNGSFVINNEGNATVQVMDVNGRILSSENINGCANVNVKAAAGVYMIRLVNGSNVKVQKVVVK